jgi:hypothetical protein
MAAPANPISNQTQRQQTHQPNSKQPAITRAALGDAAQRLVGLLSYAAYKTAAGQRPEPRTRAVRLLPLQLGDVFNWVTSPSWLYRLTEGIRVMLGLSTMSGCRR